MQSSIVNRPTVSSVLRNRERKKIPDRSVCLSFIVMQACQVSCDEHQTRSFSSCFLIPYWASPVHASAVCCHAAWRVSLVCWDCKDLQNLPRSQTQVSIQHWRIFICCKHNTPWQDSMYFICLLAWQELPTDFFFLMAVYWRSVLETDLVSVPNPLSVLAYFPNCILLIYACLLDEIIF